MSVELPQLVLRKKKASLFPRGRYPQLEQDVSEKIASENIGAVLYYPFDHRTRVGPFVGADFAMPNAGIRLAGAAFKNAGFNSRVVLGTWNPNFDFRYAQLNGEIPQVLGVGSMQIHEADAHRVINQAASMGKERPLIIGGGPHGNYQAWDFFDRDPAQSADVVVGGELNVTLSLLETIVDFKGRNETMFQAFEHARRAGALNDIPGITYISPDREVLVNTGKPLIMGDLDEMPREIIGLGLIEPRSDRRRGLSSRPVEIPKLKSMGADVAIMLTSAGCNLNCSYCPIPANHQYTERAKSPERMVLDIQEISREMKPAFIFGSDDNAFAFPRGYLEKLYETMARSDVDGVPFRKAVTFGTEATEHQADLNSDLFPTMREGGMRALWFGIEDLTKTLVNKGQSDVKTEEVFRKLRAAGISPMPMMMHFRGQPLRSEKGTLDGIANQVDFLHKHGAGSVQITYNGPSIGSKDFAEEHYDRGTVLTRAGNMPVDLYLFDGNHVISTPEENKLERQDNLMAAYKRFYNTRNLVRSVADLAKAKLFGSQEDVDVAQIAMFYQVSGRDRVKISEKNLREWRAALATGDFEYATGVPQSSIPIITGEEALHRHPIETVVGTTEDYVAHTENLYAHFAAKAKRIYAMRGEFHDSIVHGAQAILHNAERKIGEVQEDLRDRAHDALETLRHRIDQEINRYQVTHA